MRLDGGALQETIAYINEELVAQDQQDALDRNIEISDADNVIGEAPAFMETALEPCFSGGHQASIAEARHKLAGNDVRRRYQTSSRDAPTQEKLSKSALPMPSRKIDVGRGIIRNLHYLKDFRRIIMNGSNAMPPTGNSILCVKFCKTLE